jgi:murein DD-endopeptidase MepM/ murein hydrolase activator NlpD
MWDIGIANDISEEEMLRANPDLIPERLRIGQNINLYEMKPYMTVTTVEIENRAEPIAFDTVYENSKELYKGQTKVVKKGIDGSRDVKTQVTKENGIVVSSVEIASEVTAEPQAQVAAVGTKAVTAYASPPPAQSAAVGSVSQPTVQVTGSGSLGQPLAQIEVSSAYGSRGNRRHKGVDMRSPKGTPVYASDDGVVTTSQYKGSYGNLIILNHGNGLETYYAHCDTLQVSVGETVKKGQMIGTVGITGNATGYHLHFEVRKNGVYQNPMNYF